MSGEAVTAWLIMTAISAAIAAREGMAFIDNDCRWLEILDLQMNLLLIYTFFARIMGLHGIVYPPLATRAVIGSSMPSGPDTNVTT